MEQARAEGYEEGYLEGLKQAGGPRHLVLDPASHTAIVGRRAVRLSTQEFMIVKFLQEALPRWRAAPQIHEALEVADLRHAVVGIRPKLAPLGWTIDGQKHRKWFGRYRLVKLEDRF